MIEVNKIWLTPSEIWIQTSDGRQACERFDDYLTLKNASQAQRADFSCSPFGLHWEQLDEDLCFEGFFNH